MMKKPSSLFAITLPAVAVLSLAALNTSARSIAAESDASVRLSTRVDRPLLVRHGGEQEIVIQIDLEGIEPKRVLKRMPLNLAVVLDRSGSMTGRKLEQAKQAAMMLVDQLSAEDAFSLVMYDTDVNVLINAQAIGHGQGKRQQFKRTIERIQAGGSTALYAGVDCGGRQLEEFLSDRRINRVLLLSDGLANVGPKSNREIARLGHQLSDRGMSVSTIGLGDDYNEDLMTALAEASDANYYYVADVEELPGVFKRELGELKSVVARQLVLEIRFPAGVKPRRFLGRPETISDRKGLIRLGTLAGAQNREILVSCAVDPSKIDAAAQLAEVSLVYEDTVGESGKERKLEREIVIDVTDDAKVADASRDAEITVQAEIYRNAEETEKAIAYADAGNKNEALKTFDVQIGKLRRTQAGAPAAQQEALEAEIQILEEGKGGLSDAGLSNASRKAVQQRVYQLKNAKTRSTK